MNTAKLTEEYISKHRSVKDCLSKGIVNYSALARAIAKELGLEGQTTKEAIVIAARRNAKRLRKEKPQEDSIRKLLAAGELEIKNKIAAVILDKYVYKERLREFQKKVESKADLFHLVEGSKTMTIVTADRYIDTIRTIFKSNIIKINKSLIEIIIKSPPEIEDTPGVISYILYLFREHDVNIYEIISCWTDTILIISEKDLQKVMSFLSF